jgi:predicted porin
MQKKIIALAVAGLASTAAFAQTNVTIYGIVEGSAYYQDANQHRGTYGFLSNAISSSRLGFRGTEDLGNGIKAVFNLETELALASGQMGSSSSGAQTSVGGTTLGGSTTTGYTSTSTGSGTGSFSRAANVGLQTPAGTITLGRQATPTYAALAASDILGANSGGLLNAWVYASLVTSNRLLGSNTTTTASTSTGAPVSALGGILVNNGFAAGVGYATPVFGGFQAKLYSNWGNNAADQGFDTAGLRDVVLTFNNFGVSANVGYQDQVSTGAYTGRTEVKNALAALKYTIGGLTVGGAFNAIRFDNPLAVSDVNIYSAGASYQLGKLNIGGSYTESRGITQGQGENNAAKQIALLTKYSLSKRTDLFLIATHVNNEGGARMTGLYTAPNVTAADAPGLTTTNSGSLAAGNANNYNNQWSSNPTSVAVGVRHMF